MFEIGIDIEDISRFEKYLQDENFLKSIFSEKELKYCFSKNHPAKHLAARFCAKEAFYKAISEINNEIPFNEIEILNKDNGKPYIKLPQKLNNYTVSVSLSHDKSKAAAVILINGKI